MILAIDIGNSNIVIGVLEDDKIINEVRIPTDKVKTSDQYCFDIKNMLSLLNRSISDVEDVIISSVVPPVLNSVKTAVMKLIGKKPMVVGPGMKTGLNVLLDNPSQIGSDLVVDSVASMYEYPLPVIIIDMGTATTFSVVDENRNYLGGSICLGVRVSSAALTANTSLLPGIDLDRPPKAIGKNTIDCMRSGIMMGAACMIDGMIDRMEEELGKKATIVATGGISRHILPMCRHEIIYDRNLLLKGLSILYKKNAKKN